MRGNMEKKEKAEKKKFSFRQLTIDKIVLIVAAGAVLLLFSFPREKSSDGSVTPDKSVESNQNTESRSYEEELEERLTGVLESMDGVGKAEVMITLKASEEKVLDKNTNYQKNQVTEEDAQGGKRVSDEESRQEDTVLSGGSSGQEEPYVIQEKKPVVEGVVVLADGADSPQIVSEINDALQALFDVSPHKIKVLKRKNDNG